MATMPIPEIRLPLLTTSQVASLLRVSGETVRALVRRGELKGIRVGHVFRFRPADIDLLAGPPAKVASRSR